jgi:hypothetical protein
MNTTPKHHKWISSLLLICSLLSLMLFIQLKCFPTPPGSDGRALTAALNSGQSLYEMFAKGALQNSQFSDLGRCFVPAILVLTAALAAWNFSLCRRQADR